MQYPVPQFDDVEDKVVGPLSFRQFVYLAGGAGLSYILLRALPTGINFLATAPVAGLALALSFYKINNQPFLSIIESAFYYSLRSKLYLWTHRRPKAQKPIELSRHAPAPALEMPSMSNSKMKELAWSLDINEHIERKERSDYDGNTNVLNSL